MNDVAITAESPIEMNADDSILACEVSDEALEAAAGTERVGVTGRFTSNPLCC